MKKFYVLGTMASALMLLSACSSENEPQMIGGDLDNTKQEIILQVANAGTGLKTRAGRPLLSEEAKQTIENVKLIICNEEGKVAYTLPISNWMGNSSEYDSSDDEVMDGREYGVELKNPNKLTAGKYTVYAIGYHDGSVYNLDEILNLKEGDQFNENVKLALDSDVAEEIFAGATELEVTANAGFKTTVILNRQVAGVYGYFEKLPYFADATTLQLVTKANMNSTLVLGNFMNADLTGNGTSTKADYTINGTDATESKVVYSIDLKKWYNVLEDADKDGLFDTTNWQLPEEYKSKGRFKKGSLFGGEFVIPFAKDANNGSTFELQLINEEGKVLMSWSIRLPETDKQLGNFTLWEFGTDWTSAPTKDSQSCFNVLRNHLYGVGKRLYDNPTNPGVDPDPETPDPDPDPEDPKDDPEDLNLKQNLTIRVNSNWEVIHGMIVD